MITTTGLIRYCESMFASNAKYIWGADGEIITTELIDKLKKTYGASNYKNLNMKELEGLPGSDCSGLLTRPSGRNTTARQHYNLCNEKGPIKNLPKDRVCLVFREEKKDIVHVGVYLGDGRVCEMYNDCELHKLETSKWSYYGIPNWIDYSDEKLPYPEVPFIVKTNAGVPIFTDSTGKKVAQVLPKVNKYTIVEIDPKTRFGKFKSGAGWLDLKQEKNYTIC